MSETLIREKLIYELNDISAQIALLNETLPEYDVCKKKFKEEQATEKEGTFKYNQAIICHDGIDDKVKNLKVELKELMSRLDEIVKKIPYAKGGKKEKGGAGKTRKGAGRRGVGRRGIRKTSIRKTIKRKRKRKGKGKGKGKGQ